MLHWEVDVLDHKVRLQSSKLFKNIFKSLWQSADIFYFYVLNYIFGRLSVVFLMTLCGGSINISLLENKLVFQLSRHYHGSWSEGNVQNRKVPHGFSQPPAGRPAQGLALTSPAACGWCHPSESSSELLQLLWAPLMFRLILLMRKLKLRGFHNFPKVTQSVVEPAFESRCVWLKMPCISLHHRLLQSCASDLSVSGSPKSLSHRKKFSPDIAAE